MHRDRGMTVWQVRKHRQIFGITGDQGSIDSKDLGVTARATPLALDVHIKIVRLEQIIDLLINGVDPDTKIGWRLDFAREFQEVIASFPDEVQLDELRIPTKQLEPNFISFDELHEYYKRLYDKISGMLAVHRRAYMGALGVYGGLKWRTNQRFAGCETMGGVRALIGRPLGDMRNVGKKTVYFMRLLQTPYRRNEASDNV